MGPIRKLLQHRGGAVALALAAATPVLVGGLGVSVDTIQWTLTKRHMQRQADSGAIAGAYGLAQGKPVASTVATDLARNNFVTLTATPVVENAPSSGPEAGNIRAVRVALQTEANLPFTGFILGGPVQIRAEATAAMVANGEFCALSLERGNTTGLTMWGSSTVNLGCGMATNSVSANAVAAGGSSSVTASPIAAVGGVPPSSNYTAGTELIPYSVPQPDPFSTLPDPSVGTGPTPTVNVGPKASRTLSPGSYGAWDIQGTLNLQPGTYIIDGDVSFGSQANVSGSGVTIILTSKNAASNPSSIGQIDMNGGATINLTAPSSGTYKGVVIYQDRRAVVSSQSNKINGNSASTIQGAIYMAGQEVEFTGTTGMNSKCVQLVALRITWNGNSEIQNVCPAGSGAQSFTGTAVRLVG